MPTATEIVERALKRLGILDPDENPEAKEAKEGLSALNGMLAQWAQEDCDLGYSLPLGLQSEISDYQQVEAITNNLAVRLAAEYAVEVRRDVWDAAYTSKTTLQATLAEPENVKLDDGLVSAGYRRTWWW